jgi:hypothetical protein
MYTENEINDATGFENGVKFASEQDVRDYFTAAAQREMFGDEAEIDQDILDDYAEAVIENRWNMD